MKNIKETLIKSGAQIAAQAASDAKRKAQIILDVLSSIFATQMALIGRQDVCQGVAAIYSEVPSTGRRPRGPPASFYERNFEMNREKKEIKNVWLYTRVRSNEGQRALQKAHLMQDAMDAGYQIVGTSTDEADDWLFRREGLRQALSAVKRGEVDAVMVTRLTNISHVDRRILRVLKKLQDCGAVLITCATQPDYEMHIHGLEQPLRARACRKGLALPWM